MIVVRALVGCPDARDWSAAPCVMPRLQSREGVASSMLRVWASKSYTGN